MPISKGKRGVMPHVGEANSVPYYIIFDEKNPPSLSLIRRRAKLRGFSHENQD